MDLICQGNADVCYVVLASISLYNVDFQTYNTPPLNISHVVNRVMDYV